MQPGPGPDQRLVGDLDGTVVDVTSRASASGSRTDGSPASASLELRRSRAGGCPRCRRQRGQPQEDPARGLLGGANSRTPARRSGRSRRGPRRSPGSRQGEVRAVRRSSVSSSAWETSGRAPGSPRERRRATAEQSGLDLQPACGAGCSIARASRPRPSVRPALVGAERVGQRRVAPAAVEVGAHGETTGRGRRSSAASSASRTAPCGGSEQSVKSSSNWSTTSPQRASGARRPSAWRAASTTRVRVRAQVVEHRSRPTTPR